MESVAVAQVATAFKIPFLGFRVLSNAELHGEAFNPDTAVWSQKVAVDVINALED